MTEEQQAKLCQFETIQCEEERHEKCAEEYEGMGIKALCVCTCHDEKKKKKQPSARVTELTADDYGRQLWMDDLNRGVADDSKQ